MVARGWRNPLKNIRRTIKYNIVVGLLPPLHDFKDSCITDYYIIILLNNFFKLKKYNFN